MSTLLTLMELRSHLEDRDPSRRIELSTELMALLATHLDARHERLSSSFEKFHIHLGDDAFVVLHHFTEPDLSPPHDHPWDFHTTVLKGSYVEEVYRWSSEDKTDWSPRFTRITRTRGDAFMVPASRIHRIIQLPDGDCWTAVLYGAKRQDVRFYPELLEVVK